MSVSSSPDIRRDQALDWSALMHEVGPRFAERSRRCDANDAFVAENFAELKERGVFAAGVPRELGGGGASYPQLCTMLRTLARYCVRCTPMSSRPQFGAGGAIPSPWSTCFGASPTRS